MNNKITGTIGGIVTFALIVFISMIFGEQIWGFITNQSLHGWLTFIWTLFAGIIFIDNKTNHKTDYLAFYSAVICSTIWAATS